MDNPHRYNVVGKICFSLAALLLWTASPSNAQQNQGYQTSVQPDLWFNSVDGVRVGAQLNGWQEGATLRGSHRLNAAAWLGLWFPSLPISYHIRFTEPVLALSERESEFHIRLLSMVREGYQKHGAGLSKRWQAGEEYRNFLEIGGNYHVAQRFDHTYLLDHELWSNEWLGLFSGTIEYRYPGERGQFFFQFESQFHTLEQPFHATSIELVQRLELGGGWAFRARIFGGVTGNNARPEYLYQVSSGALVQTIEQPLMRSRGTIPPGWIRGGWIHRSGGPNMRGYSDLDRTALNRGEPRLFRQAGSLNLELDLPNPIQQSIRSMENVNDILSFRSYLFYGVAEMNKGLSESSNGRFSEAGAGVALGWNVPDHRGRNRGFVLRYESPLWLSDTQDEPAWKWRHLVGIGAVITF